MKLLFTLPILGLFILASYADILPAYIVHIEVTYNGEPIDSTFYAQVLFCMSEEEISRESVIRGFEQLATKEFGSKEDCYWYPSRFYIITCENSVCDFGFLEPRNFKLGVYIPEVDKVFVSDEMVIESRDSFFVVNILPEGTFDRKKTVLAIGEAGIIEKKLEMFTEALIITLVIEMLIALMYINMGRTDIPKYSKKQMRVLSTVIVANLISLPLLWFIILSLWDSFFMVVLGEVFVFLFEGVFIHILNKSVFPIKDALLFSFILNMASLFLGYFVYYLLFHGVFL